MKKKFFAYYTPSKQEFNQLWDEAIFTFDTNVLLNLYRYSSGTRDELLEILDFIKGRIFISHQVGIEFHTSRLIVLKDQIVKYEEVKHQLEKLKQNISSKSSHPFIRPLTQQKFFKVLDTVSEDLDIGKKAIENYFKTDSIIDRLNNLFEDVVGDEFSPDKLKKIYKEGEHRYNNLIPPGFKDIEKRGNAKYSDLVIWKQLIHYSKESKKPLLLIIDDNKEDWWWKISDGKKVASQKVGPHPLLIKEMMDEAKVKFYMYSTFSFMDHAKARWNDKIKEESIQEVKEVSKIKPLSLSDLYSSADLIRNYARDFSATRDTIANLFPATPIRGIQGNLSDYALSNTNLVKNFQDVMATANLFKMDDLDKYRDIAATLRSFYEDTKPSTTKAKSDDEKSPEK